MQSAAASQPRLKRRRIHVGAPAKARCDKYVRRCRGRWRLEATSSAFSLPA